MRAAVAFLGGAVIGLAVSAGAVGTVLAASAAPPVKQTDSVAIARQFNVKIDFFKDMTCGGVEAWGCTRPGSTDTIYVKAGLSAEETRGVELHEIGHIMQNRLGLENNECQADAFARSLGAKWFGYNC